MIKLIIKYLLYGIACGSVIFILRVIRIDLTGSYALQDVFDSFTIEALGSMAIGAGFAISTIGYKIDRLYLWMQIAINIFVGFGIYFLVAFFLGWSLIESPMIIISVVTVNILLFIVLGLGGYLLNIHESRAINKKLKERDPAQ